MIDSILIDREHIKNVRQDFPVLENHCYLDNAAAGAGCRNVYRAMEEYTREYSLSRMGYRSNLRSWWDKIAQTKEQFAQLIGCEKNEVFFVPTTSTGLNVIANMVASEKGTNIVTNDLEYLSNVIAWLGQRKNGVEIRFAKNREGELLPEDIEKQIADSDLVFLASGMGGGTGTGASPVIAEMAKQQGAVVVSIVTYPFAIERARLNKAKEGIEKLRQTSDTVVVIDNNRLVDFYPNLPIETAFSLVDEITAKRLLVEQPI